MIAWPVRSRAGIGAVLLLSMGAAGPVCAADVLTLNNTNPTGLSGTMLAAPPGSCTAAPGGLEGDCRDRGAAMVAASGSSMFFDDDSWSDLVEADVPLTENGNTEIGRVAADGSIFADGATPTPDTDIGTSWIPVFCPRPYCGHLLRGDTEQFDENGDGVFDNTWIDKNTDGVINNGEIDRTRGEQFTWGVTTVIRDRTDLSSQLVDGNLFPAGLARERVRLALGDASQSGGCNIPDLTNAACLDGDPSPVAPNGEDPDWWARCDPDKFNPATTSDPTITTVAEGQRALDNCLWWITSLPILTNTDLADLALELAYSGQVVTIGSNHAMEQHTDWIEQAVVKVTDSFTPDHQDFDQSLFVSYYFDQSAPLDEARYINDWQLLQQDRDPNLAVNGNLDGEASAGQLDEFGNPWDGSVLDSGAGVDTYPYAFAIQHESIGRARGYDNGAIGADAEVPECALALAPADECDRTVNETFDPFWRAQLVEVALNTFVDRFNQEFEYVDGQPCDTGCRTSGVGSEHRLEFLTAQDVNGYFSTCLNCSNSQVAPDFPDFRYMPYQQSWNVVPTIIHGGT